MKNPSKHRCFLFLFFCGRSITIILNIRCTFGAHFYIRFLYDRKELFITIFSQIIHILTWL